MFTHTFADRAYHHDAEQLFADTATVGHVDVRPSRICLPVHNLNAHPTIGAFRDEFVVQSQCQPAEGGSMLRNILLWQMQLVNLDRLVTVCALSKMVV